MRTAKAAGVRDALYEVREYLKKTLFPKEMRYGEWTFLDEWVARYVEKSSYDYVPWNLP
jgi:hypothetical protein